GAAAHPRRGRGAAVVSRGPTTRYLVDLEAGGRLTAQRQNLDASPAEAAALRGSRVRLAWDRSHNVRIPQTA
ncbi:TOBE domain-containing protein, partial [Kitasatospora sp. NPDC059571]|uniref:TOBE domain-containing protein n=1 Tax=Kitasatospora sp. NPDC059571 TaxID=3346871 RepID=UPI003690D0F7